MKKVFMFSVFYFLYFGFLYAQQQCMHWYFGTKAGLDFTSGIPVPTNLTWMNENFEGCASISDLNGNLLFYTNGGGRDSSGCNMQQPGRIWNASHAILDGGDMNSAQGGGWSAMQSSIILPKPGSLTNYYLFTMEEQEYNIDTSCYPVSPYPFPMGTGLYYFEIDMSLNGGQGSVIAQGNIFSPSFEGLDAAIHSNGAGFWLVTQTGWGKFTGNSFTDSLVIFKAGFNGITLAGKYPANAELEMLKFSPDGKHLFCGSTNTLYDFNNSNGVLDNPVVLSSISSNDATFFSFSPNSRFLYTAELNTIGFNYNYSFYQYDITSSNVNASKTLAGTTATGSLINLAQLGQMQIAPDGKLYFVRFPASGTGGTSVGVFHCPNKSGTASNLQENYITLLPGTFNFYGLPNFLDFWLRSEDTCGLFISSNYSYNSHCVEDTVEFYDQSFDAILSWSWNFGDAASGANNFSSLQNPTHYFSTPGIYTVQLIVSDGVYTDTVMHDVEIVGCSAGIEENEYICLEVFPNPSGDFITIGLPSGGSLKITNAAGKCVFSKQVESAEKKLLNIEDYSAGFYFIHFSGSKGNYYSRFIKL